jgi:hypothetical protein
MDLQDSPPNSNPEDGNASSNNESSSQEASDTSTPRPSQRNTPDSQV